MKTKFLNPIKKALKWYFEQSAKTYMWLPTGTIPSNFNE